MKKTTSLLAILLYVFSLQAQLIPAHTFKYKAQRIDYNYLGQVVYYTRDFRFQPTPHFFDTDFNFITEDELCGDYCSSHLFIDDPTFEMVICRDPDAPFYLIMDEYGNNILNIGEYYYIDTTRGLPSRLFAQYDFPTNDYIVFRLPGLEKESEVEKVLYGIPGGKYYTRGTMDLYNSDLSFYKTMTPPPSGWDVVIYHSIDLINDDPLVEVVFKKRSTYNSSASVGIANENGEVFLEVLDYENIWLQFDKNLPPEVFVVDNDPPKTRVYSIPDLQLRHIFDDSNIRRVSLANNGTLYYAIDNNEDNFEIRLYKGGDSLWKKVVFDKNLFRTKEVRVDGLYLIGQSIIDPDENIEFIMGFKYIDFDSEYFIVNDCGNVLYAFPLNFQPIISEINGYEDKMLVYCETGFAHTVDSTQVYNLPLTFTSEVFTPSGLEYKIFPNPFTRTLSIQTTDAFLPMNIKMYNITGRLVFEDNFYRCTSYEIDQLDYLTAGVYFIEIEQGIQKSLEKIVKH